MALAISQTTQTTWPNRAAVSVTGLTIGNSIEVYRVIGTSSTLLRGGAVTVTDVAFVVIDAELPFGVNVRYRVDNLTAGTSALSSATTYGLDGGKVALTDAISGQACEVVVAAWPERSYARPSSQFNVNGRIVVVAGGMGEQETSVEVWTDTDTGSENLYTILSTATAATIQLRTPGGYSRMDTYLTVTAATEKRRIQNGQDERRSWVLTCVPSPTGWAPAFLSQGYTYTDLAAAYTGLTYANLKADYATYLDLSKADLS